MKRGVVSLGAPFLCALVAFAAALEARAAALLIEVDREAFVLRSHDLRDGSAGPSFPVVLGSPSHPTPGGEYRIYQIVHNPPWRPGPTARARGAIETGPSRHGPMGAAKLPFAPGGIALHGGANPLLLGKPISLGCIRARDTDLAELIAWLRGRGAVAALERPPAAELHQSLQVALKIRIR